jgi:ligand-binding sensor domain-containing protein
MDGIYSCDTRFKKINSILLDINNYSFNDYSPWYFLRTRKGTMYVAYEGVRVFDTATKTLTPFPIYENGKNIFENSIAFQIYEDSKDNLWFATTRGLIFYNPVTKQHHWYQHKENDSTSLSASSCTRIIEDRSGRFWINTWNGGLDAFDPATGKFRQYKANGSTNSISSDNLAGSFMASNGTLYIGSLSGGVILFDPEKEIFTIYRHNVHDPFSVSCDLAFGYKESRSGIIWFCTMGGGVNAFDPQTKKFRAFTTKEGLLSNSVVSLVEDDNGNFWLGTNKGISCFTPPENPFNPLSKFSFRNYDISDGLPDNKMNLMAAYKDVDGKIYFGSTDGGIVYFDPKMLKDNEYLPPVYLTDVKVFNKSVHPYDGDGILKSPIELTKEITLSYNQNDISFEFAALNYFHPEKNQYLYKLEPYNKDWIATDASKRFANYTNLNPGKYTFKVKASNNDGVWNESPATIKLVIRPPFWKTAWFRALMVAALIATAYGFYRYRLQHILRLQSIRNRIASDLHDDIGSTLNSISVYSEVAK